MLYISGKQKSMIAEEPTCEELARENLSLMASVEQLRVQLAGCSVAAGGGIGPEVRVEIGNYGWSASYQDVLELRIRYEALLSQQALWLKHR